MSKAGRFFLNLLTAIIIGAIVTTRVFAMLYCYGTGYFWDNIFWEQLNGQFREILSIVISALVLGTIVILILSVVFPFSKYFFLAAGITDVLSLAALSTSVFYTLPSQQSKMYTNCMSAYSSYSPNLFEKYYSCNNLANCTNCCSTIISKYIFRLLGQTYSDLGPIWLTWVISSAVCYPAIKFLPKCAT